MVGSIHETAITLLQQSYRAANRPGFRKAIQQLQWDEEGWGDASEPTSWEDFLKIGEVWKEGIIPDLWFIDTDVMSVVCIEVEHASRINDRKFESYKNLWWHLDEFHWELHLLVSDRWCNLTPVPIHRYTAMGTADLENHHLGALIKVEREKNEIMFELSKIYCISDISAREMQRAKWVEKYPRFTFEKFQEETRINSHELQSSDRAGKEGDQR
ncbi:MULTISPECIES: hypothetical protein [Agrobacterium]|uniref:Uncharacterized protein n=1 Tax=Agrobacterium tumefaciens TaxID=358 RepID=A0AAE6EEQ2_AGRTU|nr:MULTISPECIES: hypothetical protein [Agrobacterium]QCL73155.1 hypothetical protein CFBP5499_06755 [Agrobacterium tumefaciens]QCL78726.1 hypothetical protein CFBP5877_06285 [Agrobacterium tumefaciens]CUX46587.1 hypothetical protein AGR6A_Cc80115 [Agrobacterium sp. NCPPB 925]